MWSATTRSPSRVPADVGGAVLNASRRNLARIGGERSRVNNTVYQLTQRVIWCFHLTARRPHQRWLIVGVIRSWHNIPITRSYQNWVGHHTWQSFLWSACLDGEDMINAFAHYVTCNNTRRQSCGKRYYRVSWAQNRSTFCANWLFCYIPRVPLVF